MSDIKALTVPKWGMAMEEGTLVNWLVNEGDTVAVGDEVAEIESSKIVNVMESHVAGTVRRRVVEVDEILPVGALLAVIADTEVPEEEIDQFVAGFTAKPQAVSTREPRQTVTAAPAADDSTVPAQTATAAPAMTASGVPAALQQGEDDSNVPATPHARRLAGELEINLHNITAGGRHGRVTVADIEQALGRSGGAHAMPSGVKMPASRKDDSRVQATPLARRLARQLGVNLNDCRASGSRGRVCRADVEAVAQGRGGTGGQRTSTAGAAADETAAVETIPMSGMRQTIARRLQESKSTIPHYRLVADADIDTLLELRRELNQALGHANITVNDLLLKAVATALAQVPDCNVQLEGNNIKRFRDADIAVAVSLEAGLITPVVRATNRKGIAQISNEVRDLVTRAKSGNLKQDEFEGGTFTLSNLGMYGIRQFDAIINPPQCAILAVGRGEQRVVVDEGEGAIATMLTLSLSLDHRVIDGATGARFLEALVRIIEHPGLMSA